MRLSAAEGARLLREGDLLALGRAADAVRRQRFGNTVTFLVDRNINYTNVCVNECRFCAFFRRQGAKDAYLLTTEEILAKVRETVEAGGTQVMIQGGLYPDLGLSYYEEMLRAIKREFPSIVIHSFTATEIQHFARQAGLSVRETLLRLQAAGLDSLPGGGAEILVDRVRQRVSPKKIMTEDWLALMRTAHSIGRESTATMVIGLGETMEERMEHMERIRDGLTHLVLIGAGPRNQNAEVAPLALELLRRLQNVEMPLVRLDARQDARREHVRVKSQLRAQRGAFLVACPRQRRDAVHHHRDDLLRDARVRQVLCRRGTDRDDVVGVMLVDQLVDPASRRVFEFRGDGERAVARVDDRLAAAPARNAAGERAVV